MSSIAYAIEQAVGNMPSICTKSLLFDGPVKDPNGATMPDSRMPARQAGFPGYKQWSDGPAAKSVA
ncbi:MAG TPA: hypothetical protein VNY80_08700 [Steroidobacteraceae bacterium]|nr:hypothetical protein [Steroidobacteraceae bacterium]